MKANVYGFIGLLLLSACATKTDPQQSSSHNKFSNVVGWGEEMPKAPVGFRVIKFAEGFRNPRWAYVTPNGDILVAEAESEPSKAALTFDKLTGKARSQNLGKSANRITLLRDANRDGVPELRTTFLENLSQPFGMLILNNYFYVANTDGVWRYPYKNGMTSIKGQGEKILDLPAGGYNNHWTRNLTLSANGKKIYVSVGSGSNVGENGMKVEERRANILEINPDGSGERVYASGLRNPVGTAINPETKVLWTAVNERDELGDELVPDYLTSVKDGGFYGWPYVYQGSKLDPRRKGEKDEVLGSTLSPDLELGSHTASLGLTFFPGKEFGEKFQNGAFIGQHGSWNSSKLVGYKVVFVPFKNGKPSGAPEDFLTNFIKDKETGEVYGRPVGVHVLPGGRLLVCDDSSNTLWIVEKRNGVAIKKTKNGYMMVLEEGEDILKRIEELAESKKIQGATMSAMGFAKVKFGFFNAEKKLYMEKDMPPMELVSFTGSIAWEDNKPSLHSHAVVSGKKFIAYGGHLLKAIVGKGSVEITIVEQGIPFKRKEDKSLGAKVLRL